LPRICSDHRSALGVDLRRIWSALVNEFGQPEPGSLAALELGRVAAALLRAEGAARAWLDVQHQRDTGKGRRPTIALLARLQKRAALEESSATAMLDRLRGMVPRPGDSFADRVRNGHASG
jgi:hypothetical protein